MRVPRAGRRPTRVAIRSRAAGSPSAWRVARRARRSWRIRAARIAASPSTGIAARTSTAEADPAGPQTTFRQVYMP